MFGDIANKFERGFVQCFGCGSIVFLSAPGMPLPLCLSFYNFDLVILTLGKQTPNDTRIIPVIKRAQ